MADVNSPTFKDSYYNKMWPYWSMMSDFDEGYEKIKARLIKWERESDTGYASRQKNSVLTNFTKKTINAAAGLIFKRPLSLIDLNSSFLKYEPDIDLMDNSLSEFFKMVCRYGIRDGLSLVYVDTPYIDPLNAPVNKQQEEANGIRPYFIRYDASQMISKRVTNVNSTLKLTQCVIGETVLIDDGIFGEKTVKQYRHLFIGGGRLYRENAEGTEMIQEWTNTLNYIPLVPFYANKTGFFEAMPPFLDLAMLNLKHYNFQSQIDKTLYIAGNPVPKFWGKTDSEKQGQEIVIGVDRAMQWSGGKDEGDFNWEEFTGSSIDKLHDEIDRVEKRMAIMGLSMITTNNKTAAITATERIIDKAQEEAELQSIAESLEWSINLAYQYWNDLAGLPMDNGKVEVNKDFLNDMMSVEQANSYLAMYKQGAITLDMFWANLKKGEYLVTFDAEVEKAQLEAEMNNPIALQ